MKKKVLALLLATTLIVSFMSGCTPNSAGGVTASQSTIEKIIKNKKIVVGCILSFPPSGFKDTAGIPGV